MIREEQKLLRKIARRFLLGVLFLLVLLVGWYVQNRLRAGAHLVSVHRLDLEGEGRTGQAATDILTLACFNIAHGRGTNDSNFSDKRERKQRLAKIARLLRDQKVDVAVLNEVDFDSAWSGHQDQAKVIARAAGFEHLVEQRNLDVSLPFFRIRFGNAILSRYPIHSARHVTYPALSTREEVVAGSKQGVCAVVTLASDRKIRVMAVHLEHRDSATRVGSARAILQRAHESDIPFFCLGDFNSTRAAFKATKRGVGGAAADVLIDSGLFKTVPLTEPVADQLTFPSSGPDRKIDWILIPKGWEIVTQRVIATDLSDHCMVLMQVREVR